MGALLCGATFGALGACATDRFGTTSSRFTLGNQRIAAFGNGHMIEAVLGETGAVALIVSDESGARGHNGLHEAAQRTSAAARDHGKPDEPCIAAAPSRLELGAQLAPPDLDRVTWVWPQPRPFATQVGTQ